ncbi:unnamed protein product [Debaryomyces fabryi]|nr:unnamed protein product [Debaryomyces fabryi]
MQTPNSPLFPAQKLTLSPSAVSLGGLAGASSGVGGSTLIPQLPDKPLTETTSMQMYVIPAEKNLFMQGFEPEEYEGRPPTLLRGCLFLRVFKPSKIRSVTLTFKGQQRTDWPEGIPPKKTSYVEVNDILSHTWPFYQLGNPLHSANGGADFFQELLKENSSEIETLTLNPSISRSNSPAPDSGRGNFFTRNLSPATIMKRATSPSLTVNESFSNLTSVLSTETDPNKPGLFAPGDYIYNFEHPLHPSIPETCSVTFGEVFYYIEASVVRAGTFKLNLTGKLPINIIRTPSESNMEENEPIIITRDWEDQLRYDIVIGRKSIVLDSYLPLAFRFVPLWGKVALHRIRVYLSENLEYYCQNKKVHRLEPPKKYLLLEHKAKKGKSLLSKNLGQGEEGDEEDEDDEILPKELEFQLFVPKVLNGRIKHEIHPDTSYENIQAHHWIKICLRLSRTDPEDSSKRKHYEILIDSPIHILSSLAAHLNTLLPAYDEHLALSSAYNFQHHGTPPLSPEVIPIDNTIGSDRNITTKGAENSVSLDAMIESPHVDFEHITTHDGNLDFSDADMHLEANLYLPPDDNRPEMASPQALPHLGTFSSPLQRPIHFVRKPSINPPPFQENSNNMLIGVDNQPPPAYEEEDHSLSMSPLRIDDSNERGRSKSGSQFAGLTINLPHEGPVKNLLSQQLRKPESERSRKVESEDISDSVSSVKPPTMSPIRNAVSPRRPTDTTRHSNSSAASSDTGLTNSIISSSRSNETKNTQDQDEIYEDSNVSNINDENEKAVSTRNFSDEGYAPEAPLVGQFENGDKSRQSSILSLTSSLEMPVELTIPLLNQSSSSLLAPHSNFKSMNSSINSLNERRTSNVHEITKITDLVDGINFNDELYRVNDNLSHLRNPRIKKHYQNDDQMVETEINKQRQKSFGVVNDNNADMRTRMSSSSESTVHENDTANDVPNSGPHSNPNSLIKPLSGSPAPGLNYGFIIE